MKKPVKFPNRLGLLRTQRDWTQEYVAKAAGMSWRHYFRIESGQAEPGAFILRKLARLFECPMEDLFADDYRRTPSQAARAARTSRRMIR